MQDSPTLVLLHGFCEDNTLWSHLLPAINYKATISTPNLPGFGNTKPLAEGFSITDVATFLHQKLTKQGIQKVICIGHSLGGYVTLALKHQYPDFVVSIGLLHSTALPDNAEKKEVRSKLISFLQKNPAGNFLAGFAATLFCHPNDEALKPSIKKVVGMSAGVSSQTIIGYTRAMRNRPDLTTVLYQEKAPFFMAGTCDKAVPLEDSQGQIKQIADKQNCYLLENVAHMGMYEAPNTVIKAMNKYLMAY